MIIREGLKFNEISFYEKLIKEKPDYVDALTALGDAYTKKGRYYDGLRVDQKLTKLKPHDPIVYYNLACSYSLLKMVRLSLISLRKALILGYADFTFMNKDPDLAFVRRDPRYKKLLSEYSQ
jgi:tetratricopeptide (TPR) repeat protein